MHQSKCFIASLTSQVGGFEPFCVFLYIFFFYIVFLFVYLVVRIS